MPFWHLSPLDKIWNCYKNGLIIRRSNFPPQGKPKTKQQLLGAINYASINEDFKDYFIDIDKRKKLKQLLIDLLLREKDLISKKIAYHYLIHSDSLSLRTQGQMDDEKIRIAIEIEAMRRTRKELEKKGWEVIDRSSSCPYDFECSKDNIIKFVEVKGTQHTKVRELY